MEVVAFFLTTIRNLVALVALLHQISVSSITARDTVTPSQPLMDNNQTIVSTGQTFALGFFRPSNSKNSRYLGIWFNQIPIQTIVWIANRDNPLNDSSGVLKIDSNGILVLVNQNSGRAIWSSSSVNHSILENPTAQLLDTGNLVIKSESKDHNHEPNSYIWESLDYPCHNFISGMKIGWNLKAGLNRNLASWKSYEDPSPGDFTVGIDPRGNPQGILKNGSSVVFRLGPWNGVHFSGVPTINTNSQLFVVNFVNNKEEIYLTFRDISVIARAELSPSGVINHFKWNNRSLQWNLFFAVQQDLCGRYGLCGVNAICNIEDTSVCKCLDGFLPKSPEEWDRVDWSSGCRRLTPLASDCTNGDDGFKKIPSVSLPDTKVSWVNASMTLNECKMKCLSNCSCSAYANSDIRGGGSGCVLWFGDLLDLRTFAGGTGQDLFVRMAASELGRMVDGGPNEKKRVTVIACVSAILGMLLIALVVWYIIWKVKRSNQEIDDSIELERDTELPLFHFGTIVRATNKFSYHNLLGKGGFGPVYKGKLTSGQEIAVKKLSKDSGQGLNEFKNEIILIAKLQHRNLVRLLGCCIERKELMLIYEYMPNKSLDSFIFDQARSRLLSWQKRFDIINGVAQGLLYLHRDSRLRVIHRDLKASNVLLDSKMNPKISDFGLARIFGGDQTQENTGRVVGTFGYMSPEYAVDGIFSMKSDVFSFGVLMLEILSGKRNRGIFHHHHGNSLNLLGHAWKLWNEEKGLELLDKVMEDEFNKSQVLRCIQVGLLCVQLHPEDRPTMPSVVIMLGSEVDISVQPKQPGYYFTECSSSSSVKLSDNKISMTALEGR